MGKIMLLDCTLRDGGYVNDWNFGHNNLLNIFERLVDAGVDIIEIGFLDERRPFDIGRSIMPDTDSVSKIYGKLDRKGAMAVGMIDYGTCGIEHIAPRSQSFLDGIRVIFKKHLRKPAMQFCSDLKKLGYKVFSQLVSVTSYSREEMMDLIELANEVKPYAVSMVDTYGLMHQNNLQWYFDLLNNHLDPSIGLGYHAHNNFQMGYANCIKMLSNSIERDMIVDGSIYGMGKSAGNAPIELIAMYMNHNLKKSYNISQILEAIDSSILQFYRPATWGYNLFYYLSASNDCHPNYVSHLMDKRTLSVKSINEILKKLEGEKKLLFDRQYIEELYVDYQTNEISDSEDLARLQNTLCNRNILVLGPGMTVLSQADRIKDFIEKEHALTISINCIPEGTQPDLVFVSNSKRYVQLSSALLHGDYRVIATSNVTGTCNAAFHYVFNFSSLIDPDAEYIDNSLVMLLKLMIKIGVRRVTLAGFDGYSKDSENYYCRDMEYEFVRRKAGRLNAYTISFLESVKGEIETVFLTDSRYALK